MINLKKYNLVYIVFIILSLLWLLKGYVELISSYIAILFSIINFNLLIFLLKDNKNIKIKIASLILLKQFLIILGLIIVYFIAKSLSNNILYPMLAYATFMTISNIFLITISALQLKKE